MYEVNYIDWKGRDTTTYLFADSLKEAEENAMILQGMFKIVKVEKVG